jgi:hypothetical protein
MTMTIPMFHPARMRTLIGSDPYLKFLWEEQLIRERRNCGRCHTCGNELRTVLDGEEWCGTCQGYRRYRAHGWAAGAGDNNSRSPCSDAEEVNLLRTFFTTYVVEDDALQRRYQEITV